jgi:tagatose 6-phosphate kinase
MILCLGTTPAVGRTMTFGRLAVDEVNRAIDVQQCAVGKSVNTARVLHVLGAGPIAIGFLGGYTGRFIRDELESLGIQHDFLDVEQPTRTCVTVIDQSVHQATELVEEAAPVKSETYAALLAILEKHISRAKGLVLSGTLPAGAPADFYARCVAIGSAAGAIVVLDAKGEPLRKALASTPTVVKPNRSELEETVGMKIDSLAAMKTAIGRLISAGPRWAVVTAGAQDTICSDGNSFWKISTPSVPAISPIGSGDSFAAGLTAALVSGEELPSACRLAAACGAANAMTTLPAHVRMPDIDALLPKVTVSPA